MKRLFVVGVVLFLNGCGLKDQFKDNSVPEEPSPLPVVEGTVSLQEIWQSDIGAKLKSRHIHLRPSLSDENAYTVDEDGRVTAFSKTNGQRVWRHDVDEEISAGVGYGAGIATVATHSGKVIALNGETGSPVWQSAVGDEILVAPVISNDIVVVRTVSGRVIGLNASDGVQKWSFRRSVPSLSLRGGSESVVQNDVVISGFSNGKPMGTVRFADAKPA